MTGKFAKKIQMCISACPTGSIILRLATRLVWSCERVFRSLNWKADDASSSMTPCQCIRVRKTFFKFDYYSSININFYHVNIAKQFR